jgi:adenylosuccinate synthase
VLDEFPASLKVLGDCRPVYESLPGWPEDISGIRKYDDLPANVKSYLNRIEALTQTPVAIISVGPDRDQTIVLTNPFK